MTSNTAGVIPAVRHPLAGVIPATTRKAGLDD